jgi:hypothetical protein
MYNNYSQIVMLKQFIYLLFIFRGSFGINPLDIGLVKRK